MKLPRRLTDPNLGASLRTQERIGAIATIALGVILLCSRHSDLFSKLLGHPPTPHADLVIILAAASLILAGAYHFVGGRVFIARS